MSALAEPRARGLLAVLVLLAVAAPVLSGGWVYDDWHMVGNAAMDAPSDVLEVFGRTSAEYLSGASSGGSETRTYRPLTMLTLVATHALAPTPLAHHLVGLALHGGLVLLLLGADRRRPTALSAAVALFALHPALAESWLYVNGRSDLVAGLCLVGLWRATHARGPKALALVFACAALGVLAKETFLCAAPFVVLARARPISRRSLAHVALAFLGVALAIALGLALVPSLGAGGSAARLLEPRVLERLPALLGLATETLVVPWPRVMRALAHELGPAAPLHLGWLLALALAGALLVRARKQRALLHLAGAMACLVPTLLVADVFWLGFDRYLMMPAILVVTACASELRAVAVPPRAAALLAVVAALLAGATTLSGLDYRSQEAFVAALRARTDDPTGALLAARAEGEAGRPAAALAHLAALDVDRLTGASAHQAASILMRLGRPDLVALVLESTYAREPEHPYLALDMVGLRGAQGRVEEALAIAEPFRARPGMCEAVRAEVGPWMRAAELSDAQRRRVRALARPCP